MYYENSERIKLASRSSYQNDPDAKKLASKSSYQKDPDAKKLASRSSYQKDPEKKKLASRISYQKDPERKKQAARAWSKSSYKSSPLSKKLNSRFNYWKDQKKKAKKNRQHYAKCKRQLRLQRKARYSLKEPKAHVKQMYVNQLRLQLLTHPEARSKVVEAYKAEYKGKKMPKIHAGAICRVAASRMVSLAYLNRRKCVKSFVSNTNEALKVDIENKDDFGQRCHSVGSEPYFYDASYQQVQRDTALPIDEHGQCVTSSKIEIKEPVFNDKADEQVPTGDKKSTADARNKKRVAKNHKDEHKYQCWECSSECKPLTDEERTAIFSLREAFNKSTEELRHAVDTSDDGCPNQHFSKTEIKYEPDSVIYTQTCVPLLGHPLVCHTDGKCKSKVRMLRAASTHYDKLRELRYAFDSVRKSHFVIAAIDKALRSGDYTALLVILGFVEEEFEALFRPSDKKDESSSDFGSISELSIMMDNSLVIESLRKEVDDDPDIVCCSCEQLHQRKSVTKVSLSDNLGKHIWPRLKNFIREKRRESIGAQLFMCNYCKPKIKDDKMPGRCVLNGLETAPVPEELAKLSSLGRQFVQLAKCFQTVVRLGTYMGKVPSYNSLKASKGTMFFLPLPHSKTSETLNDVEQSLPSDLPSPELYIIVNGQPTKSKVVWRSLVDVNAVKQAKKKLQEINWLYKELDDDVVDEAVKNVVEVAQTSTNSMLEKVTDSDVADFQSYTIRDMNRQAPTISDIEQYKLVNVREELIDNRLKYLDVMCFPALFPNGQFGKYHKREVSLSHSEYVKSRLYSKDSRFRKDSQYVFFLLYQKEMREIATGVCNLLKKTKSHRMCVDQLLSKVQSSDEHLESNLSTILQQVRGTKQYWFMKQSDLKCMIREYGPPTLFLTFSCAEYDCVDIARYLKKVNDDVSDNYPISKLCTEDPISVSRKFSQKFHAFFQNVVIKGAVLGQVSHFYWKKEYQNRGAPHYHALVWISEAPVAGVDESSKVLSFIEERIKCKIPDMVENPNLHQMVMRYQLHKCSAYCKRKTKCGQNKYITKCKFGFPRTVTKTAVLHDACDALKKRKRIYDLVRSQEEERVNDYNPLLLMLWKANCDIQFIAESSLALAHYVSGYVTKAERSNMQDMFEEVTDNTTIYGKLYKLGIRCLRSRECGLYEASDLLLGDHLCEKSVTVKWIDVSFPHKRNHRLKKHKDLDELRKTDPESEDIFEENLLDTHYPNRPKHLEDVCLYDLVANYDWYIKDEAGNRVYKELKKARLVNHKLFDCNNESQREDFYYSMILLFVPFRDESSLLLVNETAEEAYDRLQMSSNQRCSAHLKTTKTALKLQSTVKVINEAREELCDQQEPESDLGPLVLGEDTTAMKDVVEMCVKTDDSLSFEERVSMLNADQKRVFDSVSDYLNHLKLHEANQCSCKQEPLLKYVAGVAGTGKSFLIEAIKMLVGRLWPTSDLTCAVVAPTGLAAFNVGGLTIHRLFQLPVEHDAKTASYWNLSKDAQKVMKATLRSVKLFIVDEISMVSSLNLAYMHLRLDELFGGEDWFGGKSVLFFGDLLQLEPVNGNPIFSAVSQKTVMLKLGSLASVNIWRHCVNYDELTINERQKKDPLFSTMLNDIRVGNVTDESVNVLEQRVVKVPIFEKYQELKDAGTLAVCMFATRQACHEFNEMAINSLSTEKHVLVCSDTIDESASKRKWTSAADKRLDKLNHDCNLTGGLLAKIVLAVGCRVMLRRNIDTHIGLVNGAIGTVTKVTKSCVTVKFDHISDPYKVEKVTSKFMLMKSYYVYREQFSLIPAAAITIHKSQGLSLDNCIVDLSEMVFGSGMAYVALSRVRSLSGLHLVNFSKKSIIVSRKCLEELNRLRKTVQTRSANV